MQVRAWELRLGRVGETLAAWLAVQRRWMYLEAIFSSSDDLRQQLPQARHGSVSACPLLTASLLSLRICKGLESYKGQVPAAQIG